MKVNIKKTHKNALLPSYAKKGDAGMDLTATSKEIDNLGNIVYGTGLAFEIPEGYVGLLFPRSSNSKTNLYLTNHVGVIDSGYRGEVLFKYNTVDDFMTKGTYNVGDRIGQIIIIPYPQIEFQEVLTLSETDRGDNGYGSTGK